MLLKHLVTITFLCSANGINANKGKVGLWGKGCVLGQLTRLCLILKWNLLALFSVPIFRSLECAIMLLSQISVVCSVDTLYTSLKPGLTNVL